MVIRWGRTKVKTRHIQNEKRKVTKIHSGQEKDKLERCREKKRTDIRKRE